MVVITPRKTTAALDITKQQQNANISGTQTNKADSGEPNASVEESIGITTFIDAEDCIMDTTQSTISEHTKSLMGPDSTPEDLKKVLNRPTFLANVNWSTTQTVGTALAAYSVPEFLFAYSAHKLQKAQYNQFLNADVVFRIEAAPIQFQAGRLWICFEPYALQRDARNIYNAGTAVQQFTALRGVEYDPAKPSPVEFRVPFSSMLSSWDMPMGQYGSGSVYLLVLSQLASALSTNNVTLSIQAWFENVSLRVPIQIGTLTAPALHKSHDIEPMQQLQGPPQVFQSKEADQANKHVFSRALTRISRVATILGNFPVLASVATPVAHFSGAASRVAAYFGFSKPPDMSAPTKIVSHNRAAWPNADGPLPLVKLAHTSDNAVDLTRSYFPNPIDEMDIGYICSNPVALNQWTWTTAGTVGSLVTVIPVHPGVCVKSTPALTTYTYGQFTPTPMAFVASMFKYWAGSLKYRLEAVATPFHAGRLMVVYIPDYDPLNLDQYTITDAGDNYSTVWDITESSHIEFEVPYLGNTPYLYSFLDDQAYTVLKNGETTGLQVRDRVRKVQNGAILVYVLNQLVAPDTASSTIAVINWVAGGQDLTFAEPVFGLYAPGYINATNIDYTNKWYDGTDMTAAPFPVLPTIIEDDDYEFEDRDEVDLADSPPQQFQSAPTNLSSPGIDQAMTSTGMERSAPNFIPMHYIDPQDRARLAFGEVITNLRPLTRRLTPATGVFPQGITTAGAWGSYATPPTNLNVLVLDPDYFGNFSGVGDQSLFNRPHGPTFPGQFNWLYDMQSVLSYIGCLYAFSRGSRVFAVSTQPSNLINAAKFSTLPDESAPGADTGTGTFEFRLTSLAECDSPPRKPYFRPEDMLVGYNFQNDTAGHLSTTNYTYGFNMGLQNNLVVQKSGEQGCALVVQIPPTSNMPYKLNVSTTSQEADYIKRMDYSAPRSRRFLELRYKPFSSALSGGTATYTPKIWPMPLQILEAGADDFSYGGLVPPPFLTKIARSTMFVNNLDGTKLFL